MARLPRFLLLFYHIKAQKNSYWNAGWYYSDWSPKQEKEKLIFMCQELITDMKYKIHMTDGIRSKMEEDHTLLFHVGATLGAIREIYKNQLEMYRQMRDKFNSRNKLNTPEYRHGVVAVHFVIAMEEIYAKEVKIENHVHALMKIPAYEFDTQGSNVPAGGLDLNTGMGRLIDKPDSARWAQNAERPYQKTSPSDVKPPPGMYYSPPKSARSGQNAEVAKGEGGRMTEDELKRNMRAQYYQRHKS